MPVKKERFITYYYQAREEGLTPRVIRAGWQVTSFSPFNINQVLSSSQVSQRPTTPTRPKQLQIPIERFLSTPQGPRDLYFAQQDVQKLEDLGRRTRILLQKAGKALATANTRAAGLEAEKRRLEHQLQTAHSQRRRKRVQVDPNQRFAEVESIRQAMQAAEALLALQKKKKTRKRTSKKALVTIVVAPFESMCTQWQL